MIRDHTCTYYYQVQSQMNVCEVGYGNFVAWKKNGLALERIFIDKQFFEVAAEKVEQLLRCLTRNNWKVAHKKACCR